MLERYNKTVQTLPDVPNALNVWTDGSAYWRDRSGGFSYIIERNDGVILARYSEGVKNTTVSRMELMGALRALGSLRDRSIVQLITDSEYVGRGIAHWMSNWQRSGWKIKNGDLWTAIYDVVRQHDVYLTNVRGHSGLRLNEECDRMASQARKQIVKSL
jgi:ribonuclease HI